MDSPNNARIRLALAAASVLLGYAQIASAELRTTTWNGGSGDWASYNWSAGAPLNTSADQYEALIDGGNGGQSSVIIGRFGVEQVNIDALTLDAGDRLDLYGNAGLTAARMMTVNGGIALAANARLAVGSDVHRDARLLGTGWIYGYYGPTTIEASTTSATSFTIGQGLTIGTTNSNESSRVRIGGAYPLINNGTITAGYSTVTVLGSTVTNNGTFRVGTGATIEVGGAIASLAQLGNVVNDDGTGTVRFIGTVDAGANDFIIDRAISGFELGGSVTARSIAGAGVNRLNTSINGLTLGNGTRLHAPTTVRGRLTADTLEGDADLTLTTTNAHVLSRVIGAGIRIQGEGNVGATNVPSTVPLITAGTITADRLNSRLSVYGNGITNTGTFRVSNGATFAVRGAFSMAGLGTLIDDGGTFELAGNLDNVGKVFTNGELIDWRLGYMGRITGGIVRTLPGSDLRLATDSTLDGVTLDGVVRVATGGRLGALGSLSGSGLVVLEGTPTSPALLENVNFNTIAPLTIARGMTVRGSNGRIGGLTNHGLVQADAGGLVTIANAGRAVPTAVLSDGTLRILNGGKIAAASSLTLAGGGILDIDVGGPATQALLSVANTLNLTGADSLILRALEPMQARQVLATAGGTVDGIFDRIEGVQRSPTESLAVTYNRHNVYVSLARPGDASLDGMVNFTDLVALAQNYGQTSGKSWMLGDFEGDGGIGFADLVILAQNYEASTTAGAALEGAGISSTFATDWALAQSLVPEPTAVASLVMAACGLTRRRR